jgi:SAM-dependent methyltransferase
MDRNYYVEYYHVERNHWWFKARLAILEKLIESVVSEKTEKLKILNVGVATGLTSLMLQKFGEVVSVEYDQECCEFLRENVGIDAVNASLTDLPFDDNSFDVICAFDVIEHIQEDQLAVNEIHRCLKESGVSILTVPMFMSLWGDHDVINHHHRRYTLDSFSNLFIQTKLKVIYKSYFNFWFFPPIFLIRKLSNLLKTKDKSIRSDFQKYSHSGFLQRIPYTVFKSEWFFIKNRIRLPFGVSGVVVAEK